MRPRHRELVPPSDVGPESPSSIPSACDHLYDKKCKDRGCDPKSSPEPVPQPETSTYYYRARYFDQSVGRFVSEDPIGFRGGIDFYRYVSNNPLNLTDPTGLMSGGRDSCSYYDKHCKFGCNGSSSYECRAGGCCRSFPEDPRANCTRECLISWEIADCSNMSGSQQAACRRLAHLVCYRKCKFFPDPFTIPAACWSIADGY